MTLLSGCIGPDVAVIDISTGKVSHPNYTERRQVVVSVNCSNQLFRTMVRADDHLIMRTLNRDGVQTEEVKLPLLGEGYCTRIGRALSPEGDRFAYFNGRTHALCLYDFKTRRESEIWTDIASSEMNVPKVAWLSASELLIVRSGVGLGATNEIVVFDLLQGSKRSLITPTYLSDFDYSLSPDRRLLVYWDGRAKHSIYGSLKVLDLKTGRVVATLGSGEDELLGHPTWSFDGKVLAYVEGNRIMAFALQTRQCRTVTVLDGDIGTYDLVMGQNLIVHRGAKFKRGAPRGELPVTIFDSGTGDCVKRKSIAVNGGMFFLEPDRIIVCEIGD